MQIAAETCVAWVDGKAVADNAQGRVAWERLLELCFAMA
jgi:hypothetical protein